MKRFNAVIDTDKVANRDRPSFGGKLRPLSAGSFVKFGKGAERTAPLPRWHGINGLHKTGLIKPRRPWRNAAHVEVGTAEYLDWSSKRRLCEYCGDLPPVKLEQISLQEMSPLG